MPLMNMDLRAEVSRQQAIEVGPPAAKDWIDLPNRAGFWHRVNLYAIFDTLPIHPAARLRTFGQIPREDALGKPMSLKRNRKSSNDAF